MVRRVQALKQLLDDGWRDRLLALPNVVSVEVGFKYVGGKKTDEVCVRVGVSQKLPASVLGPFERVPATLDGIKTDVIVRNDRALAYTSRRRPCPGGYSIGHVQITAGTLGVWVWRASDGRSVILSNNHVLANSNNGVIGDRVLQPGKYDGGADPADFIASLTEYVKINFIGSPGKKRAAAAWWIVGKFLPNLVARLAQCPYRLVVVEPHAVSQPNPNLVDAAVAAVRDESLVDRTIQEIGQPIGIRDVQLGDRVVKVGRTTGLTRGFVDAVDSSTQVSYGDGRIARYANQIVIRADNDREFSAGGDSGSAILDEPGHLVGLLFAGGEGMTIANRISDVVSLLGIRL